MIDIGSLLLGSGGTLGIVLAVSLIIYLNPDKFKAWSANIAWALSGFNKSFEYFAQQQEVQSKLNQYVSDLGKDTDVALTRVRVKWAARDGEGVNWEDGKAIIVMRDRGFRTKNFVHAAYMFTSSTLLKDIKRHASKAQSSALNVFTTKKILETVNRAAERQFITDYFNPSIEKNNDVRNYAKQLNTIAETGLYFPVLIQELVYLGGKLFLDSPGRGAIVEITALIKFLETHCNRNVGDTTVAGDFNGAYTRSAIRIVSSRPVREKGDPTGHKKRVIEAFGPGVENVYVLGNADHGNKDFMNSVIAAVQEEAPGLRVANKHEFKGKININNVPTDVTTYLVHLQNPAAVKSTITKKDIEAAS